LASKIMSTNTKDPAATEPMKRKKPRRHRADPWAPKRKINPNPKPRPPTPTHFTCRICIEEQPNDQFPRWCPPVRNKNRPHDVPLLCIPHVARNPSRKTVDPVCKTCIGSIISAEVDTLGARHARGCPEPGCTNPWSAEDLTRYLPAVALEKLNMALFDVYKHDTRLFTCLAPGCSAIGLPDPFAPGYPQIECHTCSARACVHCNVPWHGDITCAEQATKHITDLISDTERETLKMMQEKDARRCPNCFIVVVKDGGCDSMYCEGCHKFFNWLTAPSVVPGTMKARPFFSDDPYAPLPDETLMCEADAIAQGLTVPVVASPAGPPRERWYMDL
jgi:hypothetical protein